MKIVYIAHPIGGDVEGNLKRLRCIYRLITKLNPAIVPFIPYYATVKSLDDRNPDDRKAGMAHNLEFFERKLFDELWVCSSIISHGMQIEINKANELGIPVITMA